jgi:hypothetical protein
LKYSSLILALVLVFQSCKKEEIPLFSGAPSMYFTTGTYSYSFLENIGKTNQVIYLPVKISGVAKDVDRTFKIEAMFDDTVNTTAKAGWFELQDGIIPKNSYTGKVGILLNKNATTDTSVVKLRVKLSDANELKSLSPASAIISWTGKVTQPTNWGSLAPYFGTPFSTAWYMFMLQAAGVSAFPYTTDPNLKASNPDYWNMTGGQVTAYALKIKDALLKYNNDHPGAPLTHDDGPYKGVVVSMPNF